jgi:tetratricopeptide (TPR) repeat protein
MSIGNPERHDTNRRVLLAAGVVLVVAVLVLWFVASGDDQEPDLPAHAGAESAPINEADAVDESRDLTEMRELGYIVDEEPDGADDAPDTEFGQGRIAARRFQHLAVSLEDSGDLEAAEEAYRSAIAADPTYRPPHYALADLLRRTGRFDEADREFWIAVDNGLIDPPRAIVKVATQYRNQGEIARAGTILDEGRRRYPDSADIWLHFGAFFGEVGDYERSARALERAISLTPDDPLAYRNLAAAQIALGIRDEALRTLEEGLRRDPTNKEIKQMLAEIEGSEEP